MPQPSPIILNQDFDLKTLQDQTIAVIGYGNQGRAQALNLRDSGFQVWIGNLNDAYRSRAVEDGFDVLDIQDAAAAASILFLLIPDEVIPRVFSRLIQPNIQAGSTLVFASGYPVAFNQVTLPEDLDVLLIAPRMIGVGVRERYLNRDGFYCLVGVHQDSSGIARDTLLKLTKGVSGLWKPAVEVTFKQEAILDLFNEQAFGPAFGRVLLTSIDILLEHGLPPEAVLVEMYMSEEMAYTYQKMAQVGLVRQTLFHSPTSQYGAMSRGTRFLNLGLRKKMRRIYREIDSGDFAREWAHPFSRIKYRVIQFFAMNQRINRIEKKVRKAFGMSTQEDYHPPAQLEDWLDDPEIKRELETFQDTFEF